MTFKLVILKVNRFNIHISLWLDDDIKLFYIIFSYKTYIVKKHEKKIKEKNIIIGRQCKIIFFGCITYFPYIKSMINVDQCP